MYKQFFHLRLNPFDASPNPQFLSMLPHSREALAGLQYGISAQKGVMVVTGEVGTGKTTLLRHAMEQFTQQNVRFSYVFNPRFEVLDFLEFVLFDFGLTPTTRTKSGMLLQLNRWLIEEYRNGSTCVIIVDEAQNCSGELLEEIRLLTNLETSQRKLVQLVLAGQPELEARLRQPDMRQLRQRVAVWCRTQLLNTEETGRFIADRLRIAGTEDTIFLPDAVRLIARLSHGVPRLINLLCEHALILAYVNNSHTISAEIVETVSRDLVLDSDLPSGMDVQDPTRTAV